MVQVVPCVETCSLVTAGSSPVDSETQPLTVSLGTVASELPYTVCMWLPRSPSVSPSVVSGVLHFLNFTQMSSTTKIAKITITPMTGPTISRASVGMSALGVEVLGGG